MPPQGPLYDARKHRDDVVLPLLEHWQARAGTAAGVAADEARRRMERALARLDGVARRLDMRRRQRRDGRPPALW